MAACYVLDFEDRAVYVLSAEPCDGDRLRGTYDAVAVVVGPAPRSDVDSA